MAVGRCQPAAAANRSGRGTARELFYLASTGTLMRVGVTQGAATWTATVPAKVLERSYFTGARSGQVGRTYYIAPDGHRFLMIKPRIASDSQTGEASLVVIQHFDEELKRLVPTR